MYSWGDDTDTWVKPGQYSFDSARRAAMAHDAAAAAARGPRTYEARREPDLAITDPRGKRLVTASENPVVIAVDVTGSMQTWPAEIFDRLPLLYQTLSQYRPDLELCFAAIGDAYSDRFPLQVCDFAKGPILDDHLRALCPEGGGGGQVRESYELFGWFMLQHARTPRSERPFLIIFGDEGYYDAIDAGAVRHLIGDHVEANGDATAMWRALARRFDVWLLRKPYDGHDALIEGQWANAIGREKIIRLHDEKRAVDFALGLIARSWGRFDDFQKNMAARQDETEVRRVANSLLALDPAGAGAAAGVARAHGPAVATALAVPPTRKATSRRGSRRSRKGA